MISFTSLISILAGLVTITGGIVAVWHYIQSQRRSKPLPTTSPHIVELIKGGHYNEALLLIKQALNTHPNDASIYVNKAWALNGLKEYEHALENCELAILKSLDNPTIRAAACRQKARSLNHLRRYEEALKVSNDAIRLDSPASAYAHYHKSVALNKLGRRSEALKACDQALLLSPNDNDLRALVMQQKALALK